MRIIARPKTPATSQPSEVVVVQPLTITVRHRPLRVLDFDIENRPLTYLGSDFTTAEVTAIAWAWTDAPQDVTVYLLGETDLADILIAFLKAYHDADMVTGHFIRGHDLPMLNGALVELGMPSLPDKRVRDTKVDFIRTKGISLSQESLGAMLRLEQSKVQMNQARWRSANRLTSEGLALVRERVVGDVQQHMAMLKELEAKEYLGPARMWRSGTSHVAAYAP